MTVCGSIFDLSQIECSLRSDGPHVCRNLEWFTASCRDTPAFRSFLMQSFDSLVGKCAASRLGKRYGFYQDIMSRHHNDRSNKALCWVGPKQGLQTLSYQELEQRVRQRAQNWQEQGVVAGQTLSLLRNVSVELVVDLLAALKLGAVICLIQPQGRSYLQRRLEILMPDHISLDEGRCSVLGRVWESKVLNNSLSSDLNLDAEVGGYFYLPEQPVLKTFDPCLPGLPQVKEVGAEVLFLNAVRDGLIGMGLKATSLFTTVGLDQDQTQPFLLLAGLLCGATYHFLDIEQIKRNPEILTTQTFRVVGLGPEARDILLDQPVEIGDCWETWFRDPTESDDVELWQSLVAKNRLQASYAFNLKWLPNRGGCTLISVRRKGGAHQNVLPVPPVETAAGSDKADVSQGQQALLFYRSKTKCPYYLVQNRAEFILAGCPDGVIDGYYYPAEEALELLRPLQQRYNVYFSLVQDPPRGNDRKGQIVLLIFNAGGKALDLAAVTKEVYSLFDLDLGHRKRPSKVDYIPMLPRFVATGLVDTSWVSEMYLSGGLQRRTKDDISLAINELKYSLAMN